MDMLFVIELWEVVVPTLEGNVMHRLFVREARTDVAERRQALCIDAPEIVRCEVPASESNVDAGGWLNEQRTQR